jgi:molybdopterin converting factor small subunit
MKGKQTMKVRLKCFSSLPEKYACDYTDGVEHQVQPGETVERFASRIDISEEDIKLIFVNGKKVDKTYVLSDGDRVAFAPATGGM